MTIATFSDPIPFTQLKTNSPYNHWGELGLKLEDDNFKAEYVQI